VSHKAAYHIECIHSHCHLGSYMIFECKFSVEKDSYLLHYMTLASSCAWFYHCSMG
jgi:hypothetical protein